MSVFQGARRAPFIALLSLGLALSACAHNPTDVDAANGGGAYGAAGAPGKGISATRIKTISYGKERPVAVCNDISCWSQNRRAVTVLNGAAGS